MENMFIPPSDNSTVQHGVNICSISTFIRINTNSALCSIHIVCVIVCVSGGCSTVISFFLVYLNYFITIVSFFISSRGFFCWFVTFFIAIIILRTVIKQKQPGHRISLLSVISFMLRSFTALLVQPLIDY